MRAILAVLALTLPAAALTVDEVVQLTEAGVSDEIILEQLKADGSAFELSAREIVELQKKKVSPVVIKWMVSARGKAAPAPAAGPAKPIPRAEAPKEEARDAALTVRNVSKAKITVLTYARDREIALVKGEIATGTILANGSRTELKLPSGIYKVKWAAEEPFREIAVAGGVTTELELRDDESNFRGVRAVALLDGKEEPDPNAPEVTEAPAPDPGPRVYVSPTNSNVTVIRDIQQVPARLVIVPGTSSYAATYYPDYAYTYGYTSGAYSYAPGCGTVRSYYYGPRWYYGSGHHHYGHTHDHGGHSWTHDGHHHYSRTADNVQYYLNWPFGHRHR
jgi:hypothetical protein